MSGAGPAARAMVAIIAAALLVMLGPPGAPAHAEPDTPARGSPSGAGTGLSLHIDTLAPRVVTTAGPGTITLAGRLVNSSDRTVDGLDVRVQRSDALRSEAQLRAALAGEQPTDAVITDFVGLPGPLTPGAEREVRLVLPLGGAPPTGLALTSPGSYELLVNVNGTPEGDVRSRVAAARMLLPVLGLPSAPGDPAAPLPQRAPGPAPVSLGLLYPLADLPHRLPTGPGEPPLLTDDELAASLQPAGRLGGLLAALQQGSPVGSPVRSGICLAVDPELLQTVNAMRDGYRIRQADGTVVEGTGAAAAGQWIDLLRATARGGCVVALPYADADLVALSRGGLADLGGYAVQDGAQTAAAILDTPVVPGATWAADGILDERSLTDYAAAGGKGVVLSAEGVTLTRSNGAAGPTGTIRLSVPGREVTGLLTDPLLTLAADPAGRPSTASRDTRAAPAGQDLVGALVFRATVAGSGDPLIGPDPVVLAPPHRWDDTADGAAALLATLRELVAEGRLVPRNIGDALSSPPPAGAATGRVVYSSRAGAAEVAPDVINNLRAARDSAAELLAAAENTLGVGSSPAEVFDPVTESMLVAASAGWRGRPDQAGAAEQAITSRVAALRDAVRVVEPPAPYTLASQEAPLLLTVTNGLPVAVNVRVELTATSGLRIEDVPVQRVPAQGRIQLRVKAEVSRSGQFPVYARVLTPSGGELGPPSRLLVSSTAYGTITVWLTAVAGALLVVLAGRRVLRRLRGEADRRRELAPPPVQRTGSPAPGPSTRTTRRDRQRTGANRRTQPSRSGPRT